MMSYTEDTLGRHHFVDFRDFAEKLHTTNFKIQLWLESQFRKFPLSKIRDYSVLLDYIKTQFL